MNRIMLLFGLLTPFSILAQFTVSGKLVNLYTEEPVAFVNVAVEGMEIGTVSDEFGYFELSVDNRSRTIVMSSISYETEKFRASDLAFGKTVALTPVVYDLETVTISASRLSPEELIWGMRNKKRQHSVGFGSRQLGTEIGSPIWINKESRIMSAHFVLNHAPADSIIFRLNIYDYENQMIGEKLVKEDIIVRLAQKRGEVEVDMSDYNLIVEKPVFMSLEWIKDDKKQGNSDISFDTKRGKKLKGIYLKQTSGSEFRGLDHKKNRSLCFFLRAKEVLKLE